MVSFALLNPVTIINAATTSPIQPSSAKLVNMAITAEIRTAPVETASEMLSIAVARMVAESIFLPTELL